MNCAMCDNNKPLKSKHVTKKFDESGLDNITLKCVVEYKCPKCGEAYYNYANLEQLYDFIVRNLVRKKGLLEPKEIRFLRKHMGYSSVMLARLRDQKTEHISRIENGKVKVVPISIIRLEAKFEGNKWNMRQIV